MKKPRGLPLEPGTLDQHRDRFDALLERPIDIRKCKRGKVKCPGQLREHVFDWPEGLRVIISLEQFPDGIQNLHFSASAGRNSEFAQQIALLNPRLHAKIFVSHARTKIEAVTGFNIGPPRFITGRGVFHWYLEEMEGEEEEEDTQQ